MLAGGRMARVLSCLVGDATPPFIYNAELYGTNNGVMFAEGARGSRARSRWIVVQCPIG